VQDSACSSDRERGHRPARRHSSGRRLDARRAGFSAVSLGAMLIWLAAFGLLGACASVRPQDKEHLAEPAMTWGGEGLAREHEQHVLDNREGSTGGAELRGGGCGCN